MDLTYLVSYRDFSANNVIHADLSSLDAFSAQASVAGGFDTRQDIELWTHEIRLAGSTDRIDWMIGGYYSDEVILDTQGLGLGADFTANMDAMLWNLAFQPLLGPASLLGNVPLATGGTFSNVLASASPAQAFAGGVNYAGSFAQNRFDQEATSWSIFTHNTLQVTERLDLVVGLRWTEEEKDGQYRQPMASNPACLNAIFNAGALAAGAAGSGLEQVAATIGGFSVGFGCFPFAAPANTGIPVLPSPYAETFEDDELVYTAKLTYEFNDSLRSYVSFTHGFKSGGLNLDPTAAIGGADPRFDSEKVDSFELGLKSDLLDGRLRLNLAVFDYDIEDFQVLEFTGIQFQTLNVPKAESRGAELELAWAASDALTLQFAYTYADTQYADNCGANGTPVQVLSLCGAPFTNAPENTATAAINYDAALNDNLIWRANLNARWEDERRTSTQPGLAFDIQDSH